MTKRRNILTELGVVLNFPLAILGVIGVFAAEDTGRGFSIWMTVAAFYNMIAYYVLGQRIGKLLDGLDSQSQTSEP